MSKRIFPFIAIVVVVFSSVLSSAQSPAPGQEFRPGVYRVGGGVTIPRILNQSNATYSEAARQAGIEGTVVLSVVVDADGLCKDIKVIRGLGYGLDEEAINTVRSWKFQPARKNGQPVAVLINVETNFRLYGGLQPSSRVAAPFITPTIAPGCAAGEVRVVAASGSYCGDASKAAGIPAHVDCLTLPYLESHSSPDVGSARTRNLACGEHLTAIAEDKGWIKVRLQDGVEAWASGTFIRSDAEAIQRQPDVPTEAAKKEPENTAPLRREHQFPGVDREKFPLDVNVLASRTQYEVNRNIAEMAIQIWDGRETKGYTIACSSGYGNCSHLSTGFYPARWKKGKLEIIGWRLGDKKMQKSQYMIVAENCETPFTCR